MEMKIITLEDKYEKFLMKVSGVAFQQLVSAPEEKQMEVDSQLMEVLADGTPEESLMADYIIGKWGQYDNGKLE